MANLEKVKIGTTEYNLRDTAAHTALADKADKSELPTAVSELTNDSNFQSASQVSAAIQSANTELAASIDTELEGYINGGDYDSATKKINLKHGTTVVASIDATAFIKDGMVSNVQVTDGNIVVSFNTDAGKEAISIPITSIFNASNYYSKTDADSRFQPKTTNVSTFTNDAKYVTAKVTGTTLELA